MDEYELLGGLHEIIDADVDKKIQEWIENHDVNYWLVYPLIMVELGAMNEEPQTTMNLLKRCVTSFVYAKALKMEKKFYLKRINIPGLRRYIREYENVLVKIYQNYRFSREINDINPVSKPRLKEIEEHKYELTTCLVSDRYNEENMYFFGADDSERNELEYKQIMALHGKFFRKIFEEKRKFDELEKYVDKMLYQGCIEIIEKDLKKWASNVRSVVFDNPKQLAKVIAFFYYQSVLRSIRIRIETLEDETYMDNAKNPYKVGKQSYKELKSQGSGLSNIEITDGNIKSFERVAKKYRLDFALKKDSSTKPPTYYVFFKGQDTEMMNLAFKKYLGVRMNKKDKPSIMKKLMHFKDAVSKGKNRERAREQQKDRGQSL